MKQAHESDERLMQRVADGKREPLSILMRRYANPLLTFIHRMTGDHHRSEELFQDVFLALWAGRRKYDYPRSFRAWLFGIAVNKCRADYRQRNEPLISLDNSNESVSVMSGTSPIEGAIASETVVLVENAITRLPPQQRTVVVLRIWNSFSYADIAHVLESTESTVRSNMFHGLESIRKYLEPRM